MTIHKVVLGALGLVAVSTMTVLAASGQAPTKAVSPKLASVRPVVVTENAVTPGERHVSPGEKVAFVNQTGRRLRFTFAEAFFENEKPVFVVEPDTVKVLTVGKAVSIKPGDSRSAYKAECEGCAYPGPNLYVP